jgi:hypothetical protein
LSDYAPQRFDLRLRRGIVFIQIALGVGFVVFVFKGGLDRPFTSEKIPAFGHLYLAFVVFGAFAALSMPWLVIKEIRAQFIEPYIELDLTRIVVTGLSFSGDPVVMTFGQIESIAISEWAGVEFLTIHGRDRTNIRLRAPLFRSDAEYERFKAGLIQRLSKANSAALSKV